MNTCPKCEQKGRAIEAATLDAQVVPKRLEKIHDHDDWKMCTTDSCDVVYFSGEDMVVMGDTIAIPFHKSEDPDRFVCFCFEHSVAEVEADVQAHGESEIRAAIKAACKEGRDDCKRKNPQGRCCLGNIGAVIKHAAPATKNDSEPSTDCCGDSKKTETDESARSGLFASGGAVIAALLSSACCWLPLAAIGMGASIAGVGAYFEAWRVPLVLLTLGLLSSGFYLVYRKPRCLPGEVCAVPNSRLQRFNRGMLWMTTAFVAAFALFPEYVGAFTAPPDAVAVATATQTTVYYRVEGMTCAGCEGHAREAIQSISGVTSVQVSYKDGSAQVIWSSLPDHAAVSDAVAGLGYRANEVP